MRLVRLVARVEEADGEGRSTLSPALPRRGRSKRRISRERLVPALERHLRWQLAEIPARDVLALDRGLRLREGEARRLAESLPQLGEVAPHGELAFRLVHDAHVHA